METVAIDYQFLGDDSPCLETLEGNPGWSTDRVVKLFCGGRWQFFSNGQFTFHPGSSASVREDLFPISGSYSVDNSVEDCDADNTVFLFRGERHSDSTSAVASVDGILSLEGEHIAVEVIYAVMALNSQRVMRVSQRLLPAVALELTKSLAPIVPSTAAETSGETSGETSLFNGTWQVPGPETIVLRQRGQRVEGTYMGQGGRVLLGQLEGSWMAFTLCDFPLEGLSPGERLRDRTSLSTENRTQLGRGFLRAVTHGRLLAGLLKTGTSEWRSVLAIRTSEPEIDEDELARLDRQALKYKGYDLVLESQCDLAIPYLNRALFLYQQDRGNSEVWTPIQESSLIDEINILTRLIHCHFQLKNYEPLLDALINTAKIRQMLSDRPYLSALAQQGLDTLSERLEQWRSRLSEDTERILAVDQGQRFFETLVQVLVALGEDRPGGYENSLVAAEQSRARAFADLLYRQLSTAQASKFLTARPLSTEDIRQVASVQQATLVEYFWAKGAGQLYIWVVQPSGEIPFAATAVSNDLGQWVQQTQNSFDRRRGVPRSTRKAIAANTGSLLDELYPILIEPIEAFLPREQGARIIFIPQGALFLVPFPALRPVGGEYLIQRYTVQTASSIQAINLVHQRVAETSKRRPWQSDDFLIVGDPKMPTVRWRPSDSLTQLSQLEGAAEEAVAIGRMFGASVLTGSAANERAVTQQMEQARVIHLATHGLLAYAQSGQLPGALALAPVDELDGLLTSSDILQLTLKADLVVLSACDTGRGRITGDGVVGLSRAFLQAGAQSVMVSLWAVPDGATAALMTTFYGELKQEADRATALRQAMLITMLDYPEPENWAAFTLIGEPN